MAVLGCRSLLLDNNNNNNNNNASTCQQVQGTPNCIFCDEPGGQLHKASTTEIDTHVRECATKLNDSTLLAKLAMSDMHALDAQYH